MISSGLFILPGMAFAKAGPAVIISYILAGILCIPSLMSNAELITAMPKAGGDYFYIMRGFGPLLGTVAGFSSWFSLSLKGAFALVGMGTYLSLITDMPLNLIAVLCCLVFVVLNLLGVKEAGRLQVMLVVGLLAILISYVLWGFRSINPVHFTPFFSKGLSPVFATASFVFISYGGLTKIAALAEETRDPGRTLPLGMVLSIIVTAIIYTFVIFVTIGVLDPDRLGSTLVPISDGAGAFGSNGLKIAISIAAFLAFISTANSAIMTASRYPLGMSRDKLIPAYFQKLSVRSNIPYIAVLVTGSFMVLALLFLRLELLVKVASSILLLLFMFANLTVILFRESKILSYRPKFRSPFYPYLQIIGILGGLFLLIEMGAFIMLLTMLFLLLGFIWYKFYGQKRSSRDSALIYALEKLVAKDKELTSDNLLTELKDIVIQRDRMTEDRFHKMVQESQVVDIEQPMRWRDFFKDMSRILGTETGQDADGIFMKLVEREEESSTVLRKGLAIPHIVVKGENVFRIILARARSGIIFPDDKLAHIIFILAGSSDERNLHLKVLAAIAQITEAPGFDEKWFEARNEDELKNIVLLAERRRVV
ncbi:MAG: amino acid permease [Candidatus Omnitrophica bacterium]|nr:amino acid permease [Candidatus Omnitrophota bacterium]MBU1932646.1 amino acid permease [Candidatus Omnitrophota bacterium]